MAFTNSFRPSHFESIGKAMLRARQNNDTSKCDLRLVLRNQQQELVHSCVVLGHSETLSLHLENRRPPYAPINLTSLDNNAVHYVIDWMYSGKSNFPLEDLKNVLNVAYKLKVFGLQRELEQKLQELALSDNLIFAINTATADSFTVSNATLKNLALTLLQKLDSLYRDDISELSYNSILAIMSTHIPANKKIPLINLAIEWIKIKNADSNAKETVCKSIVFNDKDEDTHFVVQQQLITELHNNNFEVRLVEHQNGRILLQTKNSFPPKSYKFIVRTNRADRRRRLHLTRSQLENVVDPFNPHYSLSRPEPAEPIAPSWQNRSNRRNLLIVSNSDTNINRRTNSDYSTFESSRSSLSAASLKPRVFPTHSQIEDLNRIPDVFEGNQYQNQLGNVPVQQSRSMVDQIAAIPNPFGLDSSARTRPRQNLDLTSSNSNTDQFARRAERAELLLNNADHEFLDQLPNPFQSSQPRQIRRANSDISNLNAISDPFQTSRRESKSSSKKKGKRLTQSQTHFMKNSDDPFDKTESSSSSRTALSSHSSKSNKEFNARKDPVVMKPINQVKSPNSNGNLDNSMRSPRVQHHRKGLVIKSQHLYPH